MTNNFAEPNGPGTPGASADPVRDEMLLLLRAAGHELPPDRIDAVLAGYCELKAMKALLRQPRTAASEPSNIYSFASILRSI